ncbi:hypothetical protein [Crossiella cryophila]|uniref:Uncharacterized protein n=1 Tax=Crossiella cryophila TaxID=43355 RepID=A0A7W7CBM4_9PSEU|nr:hypothetical protein [Crossiella cryophila]MBB4678164.1 hypothetical protein [Crossiella cryophila]
MDVLTYARVLEVCARLAGRLSDDTLDAIRTHYHAGEPDLADATLLLTLAYHEVGITEEERDLIRSALPDPDSQDLAAVPAVATIPPPRHHFTPTAPAAAPDPAPSDTLLATEAAHHNALALSRTWRDPLPGVRDSGTWIYVLRLPPTTDPLHAYAALSSQLWAVLRETWPLEVLVEGIPNPPYQTAALSAATQIWPPAPA